MKKSLTLTTNFSAAGADFQRQMAHLRDNLLQTAAKPRLDAIPVFKRENWSYGCNCYGFALDHDEDFARQPGTLGRSTILGRVKDIFNFFSDYDHYIHNGLLKDGLAYHGLDLSAAADAGAPMALFIGNRFGGDYHWYALRRTPDGADISMADKMPGCSAKLLEPAACNIFADVPEFYDRFAGYYTSPK